MVDLTGQIILNRYRVDTFLGRGGMAEVYKVWDNERASFLALKLLKEDLAQDPIFLRRFSREASTLEKLQHPNIVRFYGLEQDDLLAFILMDFVDGTSLRAEIFRSRKQVLLSTQRVLEVMHPVCSALHYAHNMGLVHCDIKPANIMVDNPGRVLVTDFGISRMTDSATTSTMLGAGTPAYMSPEQVRGLNPTPQTDIYALGITLYEMLTGGERPFTGDRAETTGSTSEKVLWEHLRLSPPSPRRYNPDIPAELEAVVMKCLAKKPEQRFQTTLDLLNAVELASRGIMPETPAYREIIPADSAESYTFSPPTMLDVVQHPSVQYKTAPRYRKRWLGSLIGVVTVAFVFIIVLILAIQPATFGKGGLSMSMIGDRTPIKSVVVQATSFSPTPKTTTITPSPTYSSSPTSGPTKTQSLGFGSSQVSPIDSMVMVYVPEGVFVMGSLDDDPDAVDDEKPQHTVFLDAFWIDRTEVTRGMYGTCVASKDCDPPANKNQPSSEDVNLPIFSISWEDARAYCKWAGRRLPTEAEWEKAAHGTGGRIYPSGNEINCGLANYWGKPGGCIGNPLPVGRYLTGASPYGALDMAGNVAEWVSDLYDSYYYYTTPFENPPGAGGGSNRVVRGGAYDTVSWYARASARNRYPSLAYLDNVGFRCAVSLTNIPSSLPEVTSVSQTTTPVWLSTPTQMGNSPPVTPFPTTSLSP